MKHKISAIVAVAALLAAAAVGVWAVLSRHPDHGARASGGASSGTTPGGSPTATAPTPKGAGTAPTKTAGRVATTVPGVVIPRAVDPLRPSTYCGTARALAGYAHESYGLNAKHEMVDGRAFDTRLKVVAAAYQRLADQAPSQPGSGAVAGSWSALAHATATAEKKLRVYGMQVQSQGVIVALAELASTGRQELPRATSTLKAACGLSPTALGL